MNILCDLLCRYTVIPDITYLSIGDVDLRLDVLIPAADVDASAGGRRALPTVVYFHGGGWVGGQKEMDVLQLLPWLGKGWAVLNVEYRVAEAACAPAAVEDVQHALEWVERNAEQHGFDTSRVVLTGRSAGSHLALMAGMMESSGVQVAAIVNWAGITDVEDLIDGPNARTFAASWLGPGSIENRLSLARRVSPITCIRAGLPPIITVHGDEDEAVPYDHATRLHQALDNAGVPNQLYTLKGRHHFGDFSPQEISDAFEAIGAFLKQHVCR